MSREIREIQRVQALIQEFVRQGAGTEAPLDWVGIPPEDSDLQTMFAYLEEIEGKFADLASLEAALKSLDLTNIPTLAAIRQLLNPLALLTNAAFGLSALRTLIVAGNALAGGTNAILNGEIRRKLNALEREFSHAQFIPEDNDVTIDYNKSVPTDTLTVTLGLSSGTWNKDAGDYNFRWSFEVESDNRVTATIAMDRYYNENVIGYYILDKLADDSKTTFGNGIVRSELQRRLATAKWLHNYRLTLDPGAERGVLFTVENYYKRGTSIPTQTSSWREIVNLASYSGEAINVQVEPAASSVAMDLSIRGAD